MSGTATKLTDDLSELVVFETAPGWDTLRGYVMLNGRIEEGRRIDPRTLPRAAEIVERVANDADNLTVIDLPEAVPQNEDGLADDEWRWTALHPITDEWGIASVLVDLVLHHYPVGDWRLFEYGYENGRGTSAHVAVARFDSTGPCAVIAVCERSDEMPERTGD